MTDDRVEALLRQQPPDEPPYAPQAVDRPAVDRVPARPGGVTRRRPLGAASSPGLWAVAVGALIVAVLGWQSLATRHEPAASSDGPTAGASPPEASPPTGVIPWIETAYVLPTPEPTSPPEALPLCPADLLVARAAGWGGATGSAAGSVRLINTWPNPCHIERITDAALLDADGTTIAPATFLLSLTNDPRARVGLAAGGSAEADLLWMNWCGAPPKQPLSLRITMTLSHDGTPATTVLTSPIEVVDGLSIVPRCDQAGGSTISVGPFQATSAETHGGTPARCTPDDLVAYSNGGGSTMGTWYAQVVVFNQSPVDCLLLASAPVEVRDGRGQLLLTSQALNDPTASVVVPAQATVVGNLGLAGWCAAPPVEPLRAAIVLGSASLPISGIRGGPVIDVPGCPGEPGASIESQLFYETPFQSPGPPPEPSPFDPGDSLPFNAIAAVPSSAEPGQAMDYTVTLVNTSIYGKPINLSAECPSYVEKLYLPGTRTPIESRYLLNCGPAGIMQVGERRTFAMRVDIPADAPSGTATIVWQLGWAGAGDKVQLVIP